MNYVQNGLISVFFVNSLHCNVCTEGRPAEFSVSKVDYNRINEIVLKWVEVEKAFIIKCFTIIENIVFSHLFMTVEERYKFPTPSAKN